MDEGKEVLAPLIAAEELAYTLPPLVAKPGEFKFRSLFVDPADALAEAEQRTTAKWPRHVGPRTVTS